MIYNDVQVAAAAASGASTSHAAALAAIDAYVVDMRAEMARLSAAVSAQLAAGAQQSDA
jgi:hypothetical protein